MNTPYKIVLTLGIATILGACSDENPGIHGGESSGQMPITLSAVYPNMSRASEAGFENGDEMGVYVLDYNQGTHQEISDEDIHARNTRFVFQESDNSWKGVSNIYWTSKNTSADIIGYYPYVSDMGDEKAMAFSIVRRQDKGGDENNLGGYESSDFLWAKAEKVMPTDSRVNLVFKHLMAGVRITLLEGKGFAAGEWDGLEKVVLVPNVLPSVDINIENGETGAAYGEAVSVVPYQQGADLRAVVVPQTVDAGKNVIDISVGKESYHLVKSEKVAYVGGKLNTFTITVDKRSDGSGLNFSLTDESITAWVDDVEFRDGIVRNYIQIEVKKRGTLKEIINQKGLSAASLTALKLNGEINEEDFRFLREECSSLKSLNLTDVKVWDGEREDVIPENAMYEKKTLLHLLFPKTVKIIGSDAFYSSGLMGSLIIPEGVVRIGEREFVADNYGHSNLNYGVFARCGNLYGELTLPSTLQFIEDNAFALTNFQGGLNIPESVKTIGNHAFRGNNFSGDLILPDGLENIGSDAFGGIPFTGNLVLPKSITTIYAYTFEGCGFAGVLYLPEGLRNIEKYAFSRCSFRGELKLPSTLQRLSNRAFENTKISSIVFPENLVYLGEGAFAGCTELRGSVTIPAKVQRVNEYLFYGCTNLKELILHKDIISVGGGALYRCIGLTKLVCDNPEPPMISRVTQEEWGEDGLVEMSLSPFDGMTKSNLTVEVPKQSLGLYRLADGWNELTRIAEYSNFICRPANACALNTKHVETLVINSEGAWEVVEKPEWCSLSKSSGNLKTEISLTVNALSKGAGNREGKIIFKLKDTDITTECKVSQYDYQYGEDECVTLQKATAGKGINVLFLGDGWDAESIASGSYLDLVKEQMEAFFGIEPYATYRDRFNVYACVCLSQESGINTPTAWYNTKFSSFFTYDWNMTGSLGLDDPDLIFDYAVAHSPLTAARMPESVIIMTLNSNEYGSSTTLTDNGSCIAMCCSSDNYPMDTRGIIQHEACGHAFGKLAEERILKNSYVTTKEKEKIGFYQVRGWYQNISLSSKLTDVHWSHFIYDPRYSTSVDVYEGAYEKTRGVFRAEINSCMNYGVPYFSAPARQDIMKRILEYSGDEFTMEKFYATDSDKWGATGSVRSDEVNNTHSYPASGLHNPVRIVKSKKY